MLAAPLRAADDGGARYCCESAGSDDAATSLQIEVSTLAELTSLQIVLALHVAVTVGNHLPALSVSLPAGTDIATVARPASFTVAYDNIKFSMTTICPLVS